MKQIIVAYALLFSAHADELIAVKSARIVLETFNRVEAAAKADGYVIVARVDHSRAAEGIGLLPKSIRRGRYRLCDTGDVPRLGFVRRA